MGLTVTLRDQRAYEFIDRLVSVAIPRLRDFRGLNPKSFDGRGNYNMGIKEHVIFPEIDYDTVDQVRGLDVAITTTAKTDAEAFTLLDALGLPFARDGRPKQYESLAQQRTRRRIDKRELLEWLRHPRSSPRSARPSTRRAQHSRCRRCGRPRAVYRKFGICRLCLRELAHNGMIPGMTKSSW